MQKVVRARVDDCGEILRFIRLLAEYEKLEHEVKATEEGLRKTLFSENSAAEVVFFENAGVKVGFALFFTSYSTFLAKPGIYLEDLFVLPEHRGHGFGEKLLAHLAQLAVERDCGRLEWSVLDWNEPAVRFYERLGAKPLSEWTMFRLAGEALKTLASRSP